MTQNNTTVTVLGLGRMGGAMAARLVGSEFAVTTWSRSGASVHGGLPGPGAREAVDGADVVLLALYDASACRTVLAECLAAMPPDCVVVNTATVSPAEALSLRTLTREHGRRYLHCPVLGSAGAVRAGAVTLLVGDAGHLGSATDPLSALGDVVHCHDPASAASLKLVANSILAGGLVTLGRALARARRLDLDEALVLDVLQRTVLGGLVTAKRARLERSDDTAADFTAAALAKDLELLTTIDPPSDALARTVKDANVPADADIAAISTRLAATGSRPLDAPSNLYVTPNASQDRDLQAPLLSYARGHATGEPKHFHDAFRPTAHIEGLRGDQFVSWDLETYCGNFTGRPADDEAARVRTLTELRRMNTVASATMLLDHGPDAFTDVFLLILEGGSWRIANKVYHRAARPR